MVEDDSGKPVPIPAVLRSPTAEPEPPAEVVEPRASRPAEDQGLRSTDVEGQLRSALQQTRQELVGTRSQLKASQQELDRVRRQLADLEELVRDLPQIFERKFQQRLQPLLDQQQLLAQDNHALREQARRLLPAAPPPPPPPPVQVQAEEPPEARPQPRAPWRDLGRRWRRSDPPPS